MPTRLIDVQPAAGSSGVARLPVEDTPHGSYKGQEGLSAARSIQAGLALDDYIARCRRMVRSAPPSAVPAIIRALLEVKRLEGGESTANVAHAGLSPEARRARILELVRDGGFLEAIAAGEDRAG